LRKDLRRKKKGKITTPEGLFDHQPKTGISVGSRRNLARQERAKTGEKRIKEEVLSSLAHGEVPRGKIIVELKGRKGA